MNRSQLLRAIAFGAALALAANSSFAQTTPAKVDEKPAVDAIELVESAEIPVRNVASNLMAYWLDPNHQPMPLQIQISQKNAGRLYGEGIGVVPQPGNGNGPNNLKLPQGILGLVSVDPQNVLRVRGTKTGIAALQKLVQQIDVPLNQVGIETQIWEMSPATFQNLPLVFQDTTKPADARRVPRPTGDKNDAALNPVLMSRVALAAPASDIAPTTQILEAHLKDKSARLIAAPRITVVDGWVATLGTDKSRALVFEGWTSDASKTKPKEQANAETPSKSEADKNALPERLAFINGQTGLAVRPVLRGDAMSLSFGITLDNSLTQASTTLRDGQTLAVRLPYANPSNGWMRVALIKPTIVRRADNGN